MVMLKNIAQNLQRKFSPSRGETKEGHFAVKASFHGNSKRFMVPLSYLSNPAFVRLLDEAEEEYGFSQQHILTVPCDPTELERILAGDWRKERLLKGITFSSTDIFEVHPSKELFINPREERPVT